GMHRHTHIPRPGRTDTHAATLFSFLCGRRGRNVSTHRAARSPHTELMPNHTHTHTPPHTHTHTHAHLIYLKHIVAMYYSPFPPDLGFGCARFPWQPH